MHSSDKLNILLTNIDEMKKIRAAILRAPMDQKVKAEKAEDMLEVIQEAECQVEFLMQELLESTDDVINKLIA